MGWSVMPRAAFTNPRHVLPTNLLFPEEPRLQHPSKKFFTICKLLLDILLPMYDIGVVRM